MPEINLPFEPIGPSAENPKLLVLYAPPKAGKTTLISKLENNLIIDLEEGSKYLNALKYEINDLSEFQKLGEAIINKNRPYKYITVDTVTKLEEMLLPRAAQIYKSTSMGKNFNLNDDILSLPNGAGYYYLRLAMKEWVAKIKKLADNIIFIGHLKDKYINKQGKEVAAKEINLTGKISGLVSADADAIGYLYRGDNHSLWINFQSSDEVICGSRCDHLKGQNIKIADYDEKSNDLVNVNWKLIYPE